MPSIIKISAKLVIADSSRILENASIIIRDGAIAEIGPSEAMGKLKVDHHIRLPSGLIHPGFINAHTHLDLSFLKGKIKRTKNFTDWIKALIDARANARVKDIDHGIKQALAKMVETGTTCVGDISSTGRSPAILATSGTRAVVFHEVLGFDPAFARSRASELAERVGNSPSSKLISQGVSPHAVYSTSPKLMKLVSKFAKRQRLPLAVHLCETAEETLFSRTGRGPFRELLKSLGAYVPVAVPRLAPVNAIKKIGAIESALLIHMNHPSRGDIATMKKTGAKVAVCPNSNRWFKRPTSAPVQKFLDHGISVSIGTDSLASNTDLDMTAEARELIRAFPDIRTETVFDLLTVGGARALGLPEGYGTLSPGAPFDAVALMINSGRVSNPVEYIMGPRRTVGRVWIAGRERYKAKEAR